MSKKNVPDRDAPIVDAQGRITPSWLEYLKDLDARAFREKVSTTDASDGDVPVFDSTSGLWVPVALGEVVSNVVALPGVSLTTATNLVFNSISLTAGVWLVGGTAGVIGGAGCAFTHMHADHGNGTTAIQTSPGLGATTALHIDSNHSNGWIFPLGIRPYTLSGAATINAVVLVDFSGGTAAAYGALWALRISA